MASSSSSAFISLFLPSQLERWGGGGGVGGRRRLVTRLSTLSRHSCPLRLFTLAASSQLATNELSLCGIETPPVTSKRPLLFPHVCFAYFCLKTMKKHIFCLPCLSLASCGTSSASSLVSTRRSGFLNGLQQWRRIIE